MKVYNTLSRGKEEFVPMKDKKANMFVCGQTVYDDAHLGHARTYISFDIVVRWLRRIGFEVNYIQNITDVDDKIIARANERGMDPIELARYYEARFMEDMEAIGVRGGVNAYPRSHDYMDAIKNQIQLLLERGFAYVLDGDVYYDVAKFDGYRNLSGMKLDELEKHRIEQREGKKNAYDFALWKGSKPGEPSWSIEVMAEGKLVKLSGRPGWHIEDTAITYSLFGPQYDIHGGASELIFPHHTNEIAQAEAAFDAKPFVRYWLHSGVLNIKGAKMSKSLKNFITIREALSKYPRETLRLFVASTHYRKEINYAEDLMLEANKLMYYFNQSVGILKNIPESGKNVSDELAISIESLEKEFSAAMDDDFNTPLALTKFTLLMRKIRQFAEANDAISPESKSAAIKTIVELGDILGILNDRFYAQVLPDEARRLISERELHRKMRDFDAADKMRIEIESKYKIRIEDTDYGTVWYPADAQFK